MEKNFVKLLLVFLLGGIMSLYAQDKKFITYKVKEGESIQSIAKALAITPYDLLKLNPDVKDDVNTDDILIIPNKNYDPLLDNASADLSKIGERDIVVDDFIYHEVSPKETVYSLLQKYDISEEELNRNNPMIPREGLKIGQVVKIPLGVDVSALEQKEKNTQPYLVKAKETKYSIARQFGISIEYLEELNPRISEVGLQIDDVILVPKEVVQTADEGFEVHKVAPGETLFSLTHLYGISSEELIAENPELADGVKAGMLLKIPNRMIEDKGLFTDAVDPDRRLDIGLMLPFKSNRDSVDFSNDRLLNITTDFYMGALLALDSLKQMGVSARVRVYDTENSAQVADRISRSPEFAQMDAVIGPLFLSNLKRVSNNLGSNGPLLVSPISSKDHSTIRNPRLVQDKASLEQLTDEMLSYIKKTHERQNLIIIRNSSEKSDRIYERIRKDVESLESDQELVILEPKEGYIDPELFKVFRDTLDRGIVNWFLVTDDEPAFLGDVFNNLGVFPEVDSLVVFAFEKSRHHDKIDNNFLARVHFHYPTAIHLEVENEAYNAFEARFRDKYHSLPSSYAVEGFDVTYDLLMRLSAGGDLRDQGRSERISTRYNYIENTSGSSLNNGIYLVRYEGLTRAIIDPDVVLEPQEDEEQPE